MNLLCNLLSIYHHHILLYMVYVHILKDSFSCMVDKVGHIFQDMDGHKSKSDCRILCMESVILLPNNSCNWIDNHVHKPVWLHILHCIQWQHCQFDHTLQMQNVHILLLSSIPTIDHNFHMAPNNNCCIYDHNPKSCYISACICIDHNPNNVQTKHDHTLDYDWTFGDKICNHFCIHDSILCRHVCKVEFFLIWSYIETPQLYQNKTFPHCDVHKANHEKL